MSRQLAKLAAMYSDLSDHYGPDDPIVVHLKEQIDQRQAQAIALPLVERRTERLPRHLWSQRYSQGRARLGSRPGL